ncbi:MAG: hypothetical protein Harvfovirus6_9 [Harvfovirus sp.]|uniref:Uncharacterized protein n=1 Tax=Harvfovirus sp. TaxID=2487768 RepID=A0A3G5A5J2_9VIRU|nr:MAG: hypothetical protein Harvfovirus6_9 [Harvfovirus sp.]
MSEIKLAGFLIKEYNHLDPDSIYILPIYSFTCPCGSLHYIKWQEPLSTYRIFHPKYLKKFKQLKEAKKQINDYLKLIPHLIINESIKCEHTSSDTAFYFGNFSRYRQFAFSSSYQNTGTFLSDLKKASYLEFGTYLSTFIADYWAAANYGWYTLHKPRFNLTNPEKQFFLRRTFETNFLTMFHGNTCRLEREIKSHLNCKIPLDLIKIIYSFSYSPTDILGKIISIVQLDILKYGKIIASDHQQDTDYAYNLFCTIPQLLFDDTS